MAKSRQAKEDQDDLGIPKFLLRRPGEKRPEPKTPIAPAAPLAPPPPDPRLSRLDPPLREYVTELLHTGRVQLHWLDDPATLRIFQQQLADRDRRQLNNRERLRAMRERIERPPSPLRGLVPLRDVLAGLGDRAPSRKHAMAAITAAKLIHTNFHFTAGDVTLANVRATIMTYKPPEKVRGARPDFPLDAVIAWTGGKNPKKAGSAHERWEKLIAHSGKTVAAYAAAKGNLTTLRNAVTGGYTTLSGGAAKQQPKEEPKLELKSKTAKTAKRKKRM